MNITWTDTKQKRQIICRNAKQHCIWRKITWAHILEKLYQATQVQINPRGRCTRTDETGKRIGLAYRGGWWRRRRARRLWGSGGRARSSSSWWPRGRGGTRSPRGRSAARGPPRLPAASPGARPPSPRPPAAGARGAGPPRRRREGAGRRMRAGGSGGGGRTPRLHRALRLQPSPPWLSSVPWFSRFYFSRRRWVASAFLNTPNFRHLFIFLLFFFSSSM
jgi:hypothetical protein